MAEAGLDMDSVAVDPSWALLVPSKLALRRKVLAFAEVEGTVHVACLNPQDNATLQAVRRHLRAPIAAERAERESLERALHRIYGGEAGRPSGKRDSSDSLSQSGVFAAAAPSSSGVWSASASGVRPSGVIGAARPSGLRAQPKDADDAVGLGEQLLQAALIRQASDIHIDPGREGVRVRLRVDGRLEDYRQLSSEVFQGLMSRLKVLSGMDIAEKRAPQDGRFTYEGGGRKVELRVATLPTKYGERMTLRLLAVGTADLTLDKLGLGEAARQRFDEAIQLPFGLLLVTGPTGSGKSTTLYAALRRLLEGEPRNIITVEDPIEYDIEGVAQCEVDSADKVSFVRALRSILRHDPDVVMIGEVRDGETAGTAIKAALTGHLVFSTLHTNSAASAITRLVDMGVERYLVAATLRLAMAQRLVRRLCGRCHAPRPMTEREARMLHRESLAGSRVYDAAGCKYCASRGYTGRLGVFELHAVDQTYSRLITDGAEESELAEEASKRRWPSLQDDAVAKALSGHTSITEVIRTAATW